MNLAQVDLNLLVALEAILTEKHLTRAGDRLGLSQPTMSHTLARLRRMFGDDLLTRVGREYYLTPLADELIEPLRDILKNIELTIERRPAFDSARDERAFLISASDYATYLVLQPAIELMQEVAPRVSVLIHSLDRTSTDSVTIGDIDLVIWPTAIGPDLPHEVLFKDRWVAVAWSGHPDIDESLSMEQYLRLPHVVYGSGLQEISGIADRAVSFGHPETRVVVTLQNFFLMPLLLGHTRMIALTHERLARRLAKLADIKIVRLEFETPETEEAMYWHPRLTADPAHRWLRELLINSSPGTE
ncbi:MAG TPA: LysR family transcriptional regulator [Dehalococcoidia bacterium]|nr:LysR family transcriptional regulator [Dehalococcoidia bacterium]